MRKVDLTDDFYADLWEEPIFLVTMWRGGKIETGITFYTITETEVVIPLSTCCDTLSKAILEEVKPVIYECFDVLGGPLQEVTGRSSDTASGLVALSPEATGLIEYIRRLAGDMGLRPSEAWQGRSWEFVATEILYQESDD